MGTEKMPGQAVGEKADQQIRKKKGRKDGEIREAYETLKDLGGKTSIFVALLTRMNEGRPQEREGEGRGFLSTRGQEEPTDIKAL